MDVHKKVLGIVTTWYPPVNGFFVESYARALAEFYDVHVFVAFWGKRSKIETSEEKNVHVHRIFFPYLPRRATMTINYWSRVFSSHISSLDIPLDMIHAHNFYGAYAAYYHAEKYGLQYYVTLHSTQHVISPLGGIKYEMLKNSLAAAERTICVGNKLKECIESQYNIDTELIPNFVDTCQFYPVSGKAEEPFKFVMIGFLDERKGIDMVVEAFNTIKSKFKVELHLIGKLESKRVTEQMISGMSDIIYYDHLDHNDIPDILSRCHALISFSDIETFGITVIEAMSCGLPVIYTSSGGPEDIVPDWAGINVERTVTALCSAMTRVIKAEDVFDASRIRSYVIDKYDKKVIIGKYRRLFGSLES